MSLAASTSVDTGSSSIESTPTLKGIMPRHTSMPARVQKTPHGDVTLTSKWAHDRYYLVASGVLACLRWLFPQKDIAPEPHGHVHRHAFQPAAGPITVERELRRICSAWQAAWDQRLDDRQHDAPAKSQTPTRPQTLRELFNHHQLHYAALLSARTKDQYPVRMQEWFAYLDADANLDDITAEAIFTARAVMQKRRGSSNATINGKVATLKKLLNLAHRKGWLARAPWRDVPPLRLIREPVRFWTAEHIAVAYQVAIEDTKPATAVLMLALGIYLGLRKNEAVNLRWCDLLLDRIHPLTGEPKPLCLIRQRPGFTTKTYENRTVSISPECCRLLIANRPENYKPDDYVLEAERHHEKRGGSKRVYRYDPAKVWNRVRTAAMAKGNPYIEFKEMRHTFACNCLINGRKREEVARWLGHKDPRMVSLHYAFLLNYDDDTGLEFLGDA